MLIHVTHIESTGSGTACLKFVLIGGSRFLTKIGSQSSPRFVGKRLPPTKINCKQAMSRTSSFYVCAGELQREKEVCLRRPNDLSCPFKAKITYHPSSRNVIRPKSRRVRALADGLGGLRMPNDLYVKTDVALLEDLFEKFRNLCQEQYGLDSAHFYTSPSVSWDALLKKDGD